MNQVHVDYFGNAKVFNAFYSLSKSNYFVRS